MKGLRDCFTKEAKRWLIV